MNLYDFQRSRLFVDLGSRSFRFNIFKLPFLRNRSADWSQISSASSMGQANDNLFKRSRSHDNVTAMSINGKNLNKSSYLEPIGRWPWKFVCYIRYSSTTRCVQMMTVDWPWPIRQCQIWSPIFLCGKKLKQWIFSETIVVYDMKVGRCSQLNQYMKLYEYQRSRSMNDLGPNLSDSIYFNFIFLNNQLANWNLISCGASLG